MTHFASPSLAYRVPEAAALLKISRSTLYELIRSGTIRSITIGRTRLITHSALLEYLDRLEGTGK